MRLYKAFTVDLEDDGKTSIVVEGVLSSKSKQRLGSLNESFVD